MAGLFGFVSNGRDMGDLHLGTFFQQHRAQDYCGLFFYSDGKISGNTHKGLLDRNFSHEDLILQKGDYGVGSVSVTREPASGLSRYGAGTLCFDGNISNAASLRDRLLKEGSVFSGHHYPVEVSDCDLISNIVLREPSFEKGIERLFEVMEGDFAIVNLTPEGIYASRGFGRRPLILGKKETDQRDNYAVASESNAFINTGFSIVRDVNPGETVLLDKSGIHHLNQVELGDSVRFGTFEWIYTAYPTSVIDGKPVSEVRKTMGKLLLQEYPVEADVLSCIPNSGRWHATGFNHASYAEGAGIPYEEVFVRYDYAGRSFTPRDPEKQKKIADLKLIPVASSINGNRIVFVDDSIVRGNQTENQTNRLRKLGAKEVHARIACPPLMAACPYGQSTKKDEDCIARTMSIEDIRKTRGLDTLEYATIEMLEQAIELPRDKLCLHCWEGGGCG
jgi:amidophosphoribosyltransferase